MQVLYLTSSFRKNGNTARVVDLLRQEIQDQWKAGNDLLTFEIINLCEQPLQYCRGCRICFDRGETFCPYWEEIAPLKTALREADVWILASPVYVDDINGLMKTFLDRIAHVNHRPEFAGKYTWLLTTSGTGSSGHAARTLASTLRTWGVYIIGQRDFVCGGLSSREDLSVRYHAVLAGIARKIITTVTRMKSQTPSFLSLLFFRVQQRLWQRHVEDSIDYHYWESRGWVDPGVTYFYAHRTNPLIVAAARFTGTIIAGFFQ
ncbi:MAG: flavodoxin family protein [Leptolinea sp.]|jgi:multimeric flavodoxin WrbA|nr:flavodoxin family protein [Leptolinea sp.]